MSILILYEPVGTGIMLRKVKVRNTWRIPYPFMDYHALNYYYKKAISKKNPFNSMWMSFFFRMPHKINPFSEKCPLSLMDCHFSNTSSVWMYQLIKALYPFLWINLIINEILIRYLKDCRMAMVSNGWAPSGDKKWWPSQIVWYSR